MNQAEQFTREREQLNRIVMKYAGLGIKRLYRLDEQVYQDGTFPGKIKELMGLAVSTALRCDDCITHHLVRCHQSGASDEEVEETLSISLVIGGSIVIPHLRRAFKVWDELKKGNK